MSVVSHFFIHLRQAGNLEQELSKLSGRVWYIELQGTGTAAGHTIKLEAGTAPFHGGFVGKTVLLVEDEQELLDLFRMELKENGYEVLTASSGDEALTLIRESAPSIDILVADVVLPHVSGIALAHKLKKRVPEIKVLLMSGYGQILHDDVGFPVLSKPLTSEVLMERVKDLLGEEG
jgi:CheY-like chemotaxis protein